MPQRSREQSLIWLCSTVKGPSELKLSITIDTSKSVLELKEAIAAKSDVEKDRQRLIYSGRFARSWDERLALTSRRQGAQG